MVLRQQMQSQLSTRCEPQGPSVSRLAKFSLKWFERRSGLAAEIHTVLPCAGA